MDAQTIRRAVWDLFKFNQKDFNVQGNLTGYGVSLRRQSSAAAAVSCQFSASIVTIDGDKIVRFTWGTINGQQPDGFSAGGDPPFELPIDRYFYAQSTLDKTTLLWSDPAIIGSSESHIPNTTTTAYALIATTSEDESSIEYACGPVSFATCELAADDA